MNTRSFAALTILVLATGFSQNITQNQQLLLASKNIARQDSSFYSSLQIFVPPPDTGRPDGRKGGGGTYAV